MGWILGIAFLVGVSLFVGGLYVMLSRQVREREDRIKRDGDFLMCWIVVANKSLYEASNAPGFADARVVFSHTDTPDLKRQLKQAARRLKKGESVEEDVDEARFDKFYDKVKNLRWLHPPLRLPKWLVGDFNVYTAVVQVYWRRLPENVLTLPYLYCWVLLGEDGGVEMGEYPDEE